MVTYFGRFVCYTSMPSRESGLHLGKIKKIKNFRLYFIFLIYVCYFCEALTEKYLLLLKSPIYFLRLSVPSVYQKYKLTKNLVNKKGPENSDPLSVI